MTILASASDDTGINRVEFYVNGSLACTDTVASYACAWKVPGAPNKTYRLHAVAYDVVGNTGSSAVVSVRAK